MKNDKILIVDDEQSMIDFLDVLLRDEGYIVEASNDSEEAYQRAKLFKPDYALIDVRMEPKNGLWLLKQLKKRDSRIVVIMMTAYISVDEVVDAMKKGAYDYITKPFNITELRAVLKNAQKHIQHPDKTTLDKMEYEFDNFIGESKVMKHVFDDIRKIAPLDSTILVTGESGTGKELVARAIHYSSPRCNSPFISVDCSAIPETLLESELFGHMKGSFTGADKNKIGLFEASGDGTIFLDEIAEMPFLLQSKMLRVLQEREVRRIGSTESISIHARIIAATNRNLTEEVRHGRFREDLFFRLNIINIQLPQLTDRLEDIPVLVDHLLDKISQRLNKSKPALSANTLEFLMKYHWPGNVRELENALEHAIIMEEGSLLEVSSFPDRIVNASKETGSIAITGSLKESVEEYEKSIILKTLENMSGNQFKTARKLKLTRQSLQYKLKKYELLK